MTDSAHALDPEVLENIQPFSGDIQEPEKSLMDGQTLRRVQTPYTTAVTVQKSRKIERVSARVLKEAESARKSFYYGWDVKNRKTGRKTRVEGATIDLAMCMARNFENCAVDVEVSETLTHFLFKGVFIDLETGFTCLRLFRQRKQQKIGSGYEDDRAEDMVFQIGQSKAIRNAILRAMPKWLIDEAIAVAKKAEIKNIKGENIALARARVIEFFGRYGVTPEMISEYLDGRQENQWTAEDIANLKGVATAITEGRVNAFDVFGTPEAETEPEPEPEPTEEKEEDADKPAPSPAPANEREAFRNDWVKLRATGLATYVFQNLQRIKEAKDRWPDLYEEIREKWGKLCAEPWPLDKEPNMPDKPEELSLPMDLKQHIDIFCTKNPMIEKDGFYEMLLDVPGIKQSHLSIIGGMLVDEEISAKEIWAMLQDGNFNSWLDSQVKPRV